MNMNKYNKLILFYLAGFLFLSLARCFNNTDYWIIDILSNFPVQYALISLVMLVVCFWKKIVSLTVLAGFIFVFSASALVDSDHSVQPVQPGQATFKVYSANIHVFNEDLSKLVHELQKSDAEIILLMEVTPDHVVQLKSIIKAYPFNIIYSPKGTRDPGAVLLSKFPILDYQIIKLSSLGNALFEAELDIDQKKVMFYAIHGTNPTLLDHYSDRNKHFLMLANKITNRSMPVILAGDFNATPFSPIFKELIKVSGLKDSREGFGWQPSWPTYLPLLWIPIDHILVSPEINVLHRDTGPFIGSDHYPVFAELSLG